MMTEFENLNSQLIQKEDGVVDMYFNYFFEQSTTPHYWRQNIAEFAQSLNIFMCNK